MRCAIVAETVPPWIRLLEQRHPVTVIPPERAASPGADVSILVRWGSLRGADPQGIRVINRLEALRRARHVGTAARRLELSGLGPVSRSHALGLPGVRLFRVDIFDLRPVAVRLMIHSEGRWLMRSARDVPARSFQRAASAAVRGLHALGLDAGRVDVAVLPPQEGVLRERVCAVNPAPTWPGLVAERVGQILEQAAAGRPAVRWVLGADPEFAFVDRQRARVVPASRFLPRRGEIGCDAQTVPGERREYLIAELRPSPTPDPRALTGALYRCLRRAARQVNARGLNWLAGSACGDGVGLGGHVHFSGGHLTGALLRALDTYLAVPVFLVEDPERARLRRNRHGFLGDVRFKNHGGFEYRTLPSWLVSSRVARAVLALAAWVVTDHHVLPQDLFLDLAHMEAFYAGDKAPFYRAADGLFADLLGSPSRDRFLPAAEPLLDLIDRRLVWDDRLDLRVAWRLATSLSGPALNSFITG